MTESIETLPLFSEEQIASKPARPRKPTAKSPGKAAAKPRAAKTTRKTAAAAEVAPEPPVVAKAPVRRAKAVAQAPKKAAAKKPAVKAGARTKPAVAPEPAPTVAAPVVEPPMPAPAVVKASVPAPAPVAVDSPARPAKAGGRRNPRGPQGRPQPVAPPVHFRRGEVEEWQPGAGVRPVEPVAQPPTPVVIRPAAPAVQPAPVVAAAPPPSAPRETPPPAPAPAAPVPTEGTAGQPQTREERIAAALRQFSSGKTDEFAGRPPQDLPSAVRPEPVVTDRPPFQGRPDRPDRHDRRDRTDRRDRHDRQDRHSRHERYPRPEFPRADRPVPAGGEPILAIPEGPAAEPVFAEGLVEVSGKGFGFLRDPKRSYAQHPADVFVTPEICRQFTLRDGMWIKGEVRRGNRGPQLYKLTEIEGEDPEKYLRIPMFEELTTINPNKWVKLETTPERFTTRVIDLMAPIGKGQRGIIVAPPRTGKTTFLQHIAEAIGKNHPYMKLIILLVDERPEEVTEIRRTVPFAEIMASSNDQEVKSHTRIAQLAIERARRLVEMGKDVFVLLDSITRVGRAFNNAMGGGGRTMSGGVDARALEIPRKLFASARNTEEAGSLTIIATALIETGSKMDELIFQEFKGTGNMELVLDRKISDLRIYPAVDIFQSGTRRDELLLSEAELYKINIIRRGLAGHKPPEAIERLLYFLQKFPTNAQMLKEIPG